LLYNRRRELSAAPRRACLWGLPLMILALAAQIVSFYPISNLWLCQLCMVAVLFFLVLYLAGPSVLRLTWLPILYLGLAMPIPGYLYAKVSVPLQEVAALGSALILRLFGVEIEVTHSHLKILTQSQIWRDLTVAEACSGVRSLMAYVALGVAWAYLEERPLWQRVVLVAAIVPVAILCNVIRVAITCATYVFDRPELGQKFMHSFTGMVMLIPAVLMFLALSWLLKSLFVDVEPPEGPSEKRTSPREAVT
jgi:exosortase